jgi:hypothetical protein
MKRTGKIARLPHDIREKLNLCLQDNVPGDKLLEWLNGQEAVQAVLAEQFGGADITKQNLSEWRTGGFAEWVLGQEVVYEAQDADEGARRLDAVTNSNLPDRLATVLAGRYASLLARWDGEVTEAFTKKLRALGPLCREICALRRSHHNAIKVKIAQELHAERHGGETGKDEGRMKNEESEKRPGASDESGSVALSPTSFTPNLEAERCPDPKTEAGESQVEAAPAPILRSSLCLPHSPTGSESVAPGPTTFPSNSETTASGGVAASCRHPERGGKLAPKPTESYLNMLLAASRAKVLPVQPPIAPLPDWVEESVMD